MLIPLRDDNPTQLTPVVSYAIIAACVLVFLWQISLGANQQAAVYSLGLIPTVLLQGASLPPELTTVPPLATVFTSMFLHGGWLHLIGNMLYLWIFADNIEDAMGHGRFVVFYLLCGIAAALGQILMQTDSIIPMLGASGAISGVLGGYLLLFPRRRVRALIFNFLTEVPAFVALGIWIVYQIVIGYLTPAGTGGVAYAAHIGGFIAGLVLIKIFAIGRQKSSP